MSDGHGAVRGTDSGSAPGSPGERDPIDVQTRFERFPVSIKGAFVMRGADGNPHSVRIQSARLARMPQGAGMPFAVESRLLDVAPGRDLFVPFEAPVSEIEPGWYAVESTVQVDGGRSFVFMGRPFVMSWPRNDIRRGTIAVGLKVKVGRREVRLDRVEMGGDSAAVVWWPLEPDGKGSEAATGDEGQVQGEAILIADGHPLETLPPAAGRRIRTPDARAMGEHRTLSYPVPRSARSLAVVVRLASGGRSEPLPLSFI